MAVLSRLEGLALVDQHCHAVLRHIPDRAAFELLASEGFDPPPGGTSHLDSPVGLAIRRWCAPIVDLEPLASSDEYVTNRLALGPEEANRRLLRASGLEALLIDTGYRADEVLTLREMADVSQAHVHEVVRLESVAEEVALAGGDAARYVDAFRERLWARASSAVGLKTIAAYRCGLDLDPEPPSYRDVVQAAGAYLSAVSRDTGTRLRDPVLIRFGLWAGFELAAERGMPVQVHAGFGDPDLTLHLADPSRFTPVVKAIRSLGVPLVFLHCYPYHRQAAYLASVFPNVYFDVGGALSYLGPSASHLLSDALEVAPFAKLLYASDAFGLAEFYFVGAALFRAALETVLGRWVAAESCTVSEAEQIAMQVSRENALRIYPVASGHAGWAVS
jgi:predicted TIM-barrel fold metal-dependent hydrolase